MLKSAILGYPRFGLRRELKRTLESFWKGQSTETDLRQVGAELRHYNWQLMSDAGINIIPSNDFSYYDQMLDATAMVGAVPSRYRWSGVTVDLSTYFAMARGAQNDGLDVPAMEMTKWFDTNYHFIVPEFQPDQTFRLGSSKAVDEYREAKALGIETRPVVIGPVSYLLLGKTIDADVSPLSLLTKLVPVYSEVLDLLARAGATQVQIDEPCLVLDLDQSVRSAYKTTYEILGRNPSLKIMLSTYFGGLGDNLATVMQLPFDGLHIDLVRAPNQLDEVLRALPEDRKLSIGIIDGRNVWRTDLDQAFIIIKKATKSLGVERTVIAPSSSLQFCPYDLDLETDLDEEMRSWLAFSKQKIVELTILQKAVNGGNVSKELENNRDALLSRRQSGRTSNPAVRERLARLTPDMFQRESDHRHRKIAQAASIRLPRFPTTTIGSFPQTQEVRAKRAAYRKGSITYEEYEDFLKRETERVIRLQEVLGLDVLVHGEFERTDMVEYFGEQLTGIAFTKHGWVQSFGSRGVRPPIIYGDVTRPRPMTVKWSVFAQSLTERPVKGMLTGPVTILQWSFVRDDQPHAETCRQIALVIRDEVVDLEANGISIIQIDEPAMREGLPLRHADWDEYLQWAVECFRLTAGGVKDETQVHTHMCYADFNDIIQAISAMDADVISIEASRSKMELLNAFKDYRYPNDIGPGVYDIHSPRIPKQVEVESLLIQAQSVLDPSQLWVNPDCGLKTRSWDEVEPALRAMVGAARNLRNYAK